MAGEERFTRELEQYLEEFLHYLFAVRGYSEATVATYEQPLRQMLEESRILREGEGWRIDLLPWRRTISSNTHRTIAKKLSAVRSFVRYLNEQRGMKVSLRGDEAVPTPQTLPKPIDESYIQEVMEEADVQERLILALLYGLGLRISELASLRRAAVEGEWIQVTGKGEKSRQIPVPAGVRRLLEEYRALYPQGIYLFEKGGVPLNEAQLRYRVQKIFKAHGIKATPHQLRHSFATHLLRHGARISDVSELLGHASMATTQIYTKLGSAKKLEEYKKAHPLMKNDE